MLSAVLSTAKSSIPSGIKQRIGAPDLARRMDPDADDRYATDEIVATLARGNRNGRRMRYRRPYYRELLGATLGCRDIMTEIMSFFSDDELLDNLISYLANFRDLIQIDVCLPILKQRRVWYCKNDVHLQFLKECLQNETVFKNTELVVTFSFPQKFVSTIEKFSIVHLNTVSILKRQLMEILNTSTSKIEHLKFTNFSFNEKESAQEKLPLRIMRITPYLRTITFKTDYLNLHFLKKFQGEEEKDKKESMKLENPINSLSNNLDLNSSNIEELIFSKVCSHHDVSLVSILSNKLKRLSLVSIPLGISNLNLHLDHFQIESFPITNSIQSTTLTITHPNSVLPTIPRSEKIKQLILKKSVSFKSERQSLRSFLKNVLKCFPNCEELVIPEIFMDMLTESDLNEDEITCSLKKIIIKHSATAQTSIYGSLKFALQFFFSPKVLISLEEIKKDECDFETHKSSNRTIVLDCYEDLLFKKIESAEKHFKVMDNDLIKERIREMKKTFAKCILSNNFSKFALIADSLNILDGLKSNKKIMLQAIHQAIENYHDIFDNDQLFMLTTQKFDECESLFEGEYFSEYHFSKYYSELEVLFHQMIQVVEENGYPSKVLFNEQWFNEQIVELYGHQSDEIQVYADSQEEMEKACNELFDGDVYSDLEDDEYDCEL